MRSPGVVVLIGLLAAACSTMRLALPTDPAWDGAGCRGVGLDGILRSSPSDPRLFWMEDRATGERAELIWPAGYYARDDFGLEVIDGSDTFVGKAGDLLTGACSSPPYHVSADEVESAP